MNKLNSVLLKQFRTIFFEIPAFHFEYIEVFDEISSIPKYGTLLLQVGNLLPQVGTLLP